MSLEVGVPRFVGLLHLVADAAGVAQVEVAGLHVVADVALHGGAVLALQAAEPLARPQVDHLGHHQVLVAFQQGYIRSPWQVMQYRTFFGMTNILLMFYIYIIGNVEFPINFGKYILFWVPCLCA